MELTLPLAFVAGLGTFLSPCVLPLVPAYLSSLSGTDLSIGDTHTNRWPIFLQTLFFVLGLTVVFVLLGMAAGAAGSALRTHLTLVRLISGGLLAALGTFMLASLRFPRLNYGARLPPPAGMAAGYLRSFLTGGAFGLAWTPCAGPVLGGILALGFASETAATGTLLLFIYALGVGAPFLAAGVAVNSVQPALRWLRVHAGDVTLFSGVLLIVIGILVLTDKLGFLGGVLNGAN